MDEREHIESGDCWCNPEIEYVPARPTDKSVGHLDEYRGQ